MSTPRHVMTWDESFAAVRRIAEASSPFDAFADLVVARIETGDFRGPFCVLQNLAYHPNVDVAALHGYLVGSIDSWRRLHRIHGDFASPSSPVVYVDTAIVDAGSHHSDQWDRMPCLPLLTDRSTSAMVLAGQIRRNPEAVKKVLELSHAGKAIDPSVAQRYEQYVGMVALDRAAYFLGAHQCWSPFSARLLGSTECVTFRGRMAHNLLVRYEDSEPFYLLHSGAFMLPSAIIVPGSQTIYRFDRTSLGETEISAAVATAVETEARRRGALGAPILEAQPAILLPHLNPGHHVWNGLGGAATLARSETELPVLDLSETPLPPADQMLTGNPVRLLREDDGVAAISSGRIVPFLFLDFFFDGREAHEPDHAAAVDAIDQDRAADFVLWIGIRGHNRRWLNVAECCAAVVERMVALGRGVHILVDGVTSPASGALLPPSLTEQEVADYETIKEKLAGIAEVTSLIGASAKEKVRRSQKVHFFIEAYGSGNLWNSWIGNNPGIYLAPSAVSSEARDIYKYTSNPARRIYLDQSFIEDLNQGNYNSDMVVDPQQLAIATVAAVQIDRA